MSDSNVTVRALFQGPTGVSGPKGARGAQGPPVSDLPLTSPSVHLLFSFCLAVAHVETVFLLGCFFRVPLVSLVPPAALDPLVPM